MTPRDDQFRIRRFQLIDGCEARPYCKLLKVRQVMETGFRLYEDGRGLHWLEIADHEHSCLLPLSQETFEQRVAAELLTLGLNKYSG